MGNKIKKKCCDLKEKLEEAYDVVELKTGGIGAAAEAEDEDLVEGIPDDPVHFPLPSQGRQKNGAHLPSLTYLRAREMLVILRRRREMERSEKQP